MQGETDQPNGQASDGRVENAEASAATPPRILPPAAQRALAEAEARRAARTEKPQPAEIGGRGGLEPGRYGDWEIKGLTSDF